MVSVIICTFNRYLMLQDAVRSFLSCEKAGIDYELLLVDNNSTDKTRKFAEGLAARDPHVRYVIEPSPGLSYARNHGIRASRGEILAFVDDDVYFSPLWLKAIVSAFERNHDFDCIGGKVEPHFESPRPSWLKDDFLWIYGITRYGDEEREIQPPEIPIGCNMAFRREIFKRIKSFTTSLGRKPGILLSGDENYFLLRAKNEGIRTLYSPNAKIFHRIPFSRTSPKWILSRYYWEGVTDSVMLQVGDKPLSRANLSKKSFLTLLRIICQWKGIVGLIGGKLRTGESGSIKKQRQLCYQLGLLRQMIVEILSAPKRNSYNS